MKPARFGITFGIRPLFFPQVCAGDGPCHAAKEILAPHESLFNRIISQEPAFVNGHFCGGSEMQGCEGR
jgi:hypothetical protein